MSLIIWTRNFLEDQGFRVNDNIVYQDNQSAMLLEKNGKSSSGRRTRHLNIRYFFISDQVKNGELRIEYCPTESMVGDFFTKPLQGSTFKNFRQISMNLDDDVPLPLTTTKSQECVGASASMLTYADAVRSTDRKKSVIVPDKSVRHVSRKQPLIWRHQ